VERLKIFAYYNLIN